MKTLRKLFYIIFAAYLVAGCLNFAVLADEYDGENIYYEHEYVEDTDVPLYDETSSTTGLEGVALHTAIPAIIISLVIIIIMTAVILIKKLVLFFARGNEGKNKKVKREKAG